jgi:serine/threonine protein kinase
VLRSKIIRGLCLSQTTGKWSEEHILLPTQVRDEQLNVGYVMTPLTLRRTLCGEIIKGTKVIKKDFSEVEYDINDEQLNSLVGEYSGSLWLETDDYVAIKVDRRHSMQRLHDKSSTLTNPENPWKEVAALQLLNSHPNVINLLGAFVDDECLYEVMPYCSGGSLSKFMLHYQNGMPEAQARQKFLQITLALFHIHSHGVCHHDISADNVMLDGTRCILIDFGMSLRVPHSYIDDPTGATDDVTDFSMGTTRRLIHSHCHCGKLRFMPPEIYAKKYAIDGLAADIWSTGVVLFLMITGRQPYERPDMKDPGYYDLINESFYWSSTVNPLVSWGRVISSELIDLLKIMLRPNPRERATLRQILNHSWLVNK